MARVWNPILVAAAVPRAGNAWGRDPEWVGVVRARTRRQLTVRDGKGGTDRRILLPSSLVEQLRGHLEEVRQVHRADLAAGYGRVDLTHALTSKYPNASVEWGRHLHIASAIRSPPTCWNTGRTSAPSRSCWFTGM